MTARSQKKSHSKMPKEPTIKRRFLGALTGAREDAYRRVLDAIAYKRREPKSSLTKAAKQNGTTVKTILKYGGSAIDVRSGRFDVKSSDRLPRRMRMLTPVGEEVVLTTSSRTATMISNYNNALREYALTRDTNELKKFANKTVRSGGQTYAFATDSRSIDRHIRAGAVHFVDIYVSGFKA